jgi:uncharacterized membrane protein YqhA
MKILFKIIVGIPVISSMFIALVFIGAGVYTASLGTYGIFRGELGTETTPGLRLIDSLDLFLLGFLFLIFSIGFSQLFFPKPSILMRIIDTITPDWLKVKSFTELKLILWDTLLTTLVIKFVSDAFIAHEVYHWQLIIIPIGILLISLSRFLIKKDKSH